MNYPRIDVNHPLTVAAREVNSQTAKNGLPATLEEIRIGTGFGQLSYLAEQRALRVLLAMRGINLDNASAIILSEYEKSILPALTIACLDGMVIGWRGHTISESQHAS